MVITKGEIDTTDKPFIPPNSYSKHGIGKEQADQTPRGLGVDEVNLIERSKDSWIACNTEMLAPAKTVEVAL